MADNEEPSKESSYRVKTQRVELEVFWQLEGESTPTEILGLSTEGVEFIAYKHHVQGVKQGDTCRQIFHDLASGNHIEVEGLIREMVDDQDLWRVDVEFTDPAKLAEQLGDSSIWAYFNRRHFFRVHPRLSEYQPAKIELKWRGASGDYLLHDVSVRGLSIRLSKHDDLVVPDGRPIRASLVLPNKAEPQTMVLKKLHEVVTPSHRRIGFAIDPMRTACMPKVEDCLIAAVMEWQRRALAMKANRGLEIEDPIQIETRRKGA